MEIKTNRLLLFISIIFVSLIALSALSAADVDDTVAVSTDDDSDVVALDSGVEVESADADVSDVVAIESDDVATASEDEILSDEPPAEEGTETGDSSDSGSGSSFDFSKLFNGTSIDFGNGTSFDLGSLFNGTNITFGNGTSLNTSSLLGANLTFGNGTSLNISSLIGGNGTSFDFSSILNIFGGTKETINASDVSKVFTTNTKFSVTVSKGNSTLTSGSVIFTIDNKEYVGHIGSNGVATVSLKNLKPGKHYITSEYGDTIVKNVITVKKATPKLTAKAKTFKKSQKVKKYTITLKTNEKKALKKVKVTIKVKGKTYKAKTNSKGKATFKITKLTKKGKSKATVKFAGNAYYKAVSKKVTITVK